MIEIKGTYTNAIVYTDVVEDTALEQIKTLCDQSFVEDCKIRIMPDVHAGAGCVIGFTADLNQRVILILLVWILVVVCYVSIWENPLLTL